MAELQSGLLNDGCHVKTIISPIASTYTFNWTVENFSKFPLGKEKKSPTFLPQPNQVFCATLLLRQDFDCYLNFHRKSETRVEVNHNVSIENKAGQVVLKHVKLHTYADSSGCDVLPSCAKIMEKAREEDVLIIKCFMEFNVEEETDTYHYKSHSKPVLDDLPALSMDLQAMFVTSVYTDVSLKVGDNNVRVHKSVLCARSSVFAKMFATPMGENEKNIVDISDLELPVLEALVSYLYTGMLDKDDFESVYSLYYAADKYDVSSLRKICVGILLSKMEVGNASRILALADQHSDVECKNSVTNFINFYFDEVLETDAWDELVKNTPRLATEVISSWGKNRKNKVENIKT